MHTLAIAGIDDAVVIVVIIVVVVIGLGIWWLTTNSYQMVLTSTGATMPLYGKVTVTASFQERTWRFGNWASVPANFRIGVSSSGVLAPSVQTSITGAASPVLTFDVTGTGTGSDTVSINATRVGGSEAAGGTVALTVTGG